MILGIILTVLLGTVTLGATGSMDREQAPIERYSADDYAN